LSKILPISTNCRVMLTDNIWVPRGIVNGALGTVKDIVWASTIDPNNARKEMPLTLLIHFDNYNGPEYILYEGQKLVPIFPSKRDWTRGGIHCTRTQFPL
ncbi:hypothetical protein DM02DRAFT_506239, partial [Periconia macrospinosa]